jgi:hypothetical protein
MLRIKWKCYSNSKEYWNKKLDDQNIDPENLLRQVWSDNPYWRKKGYQE